MAERNIHHQNIQTAYNHIKGALCQPENMDLPLDDEFRRIYNYLNCWREESNRNDWPEVYEMESRQIEPVAMMYRKMLIERLG